MYGVIPTENVRIPKLLANCAWAIVSTGELDIPSVKTTIFNGTDRGKDVNIEVAKLIPKSVAVLPASHSVERMLELIAPRVNVFVMLIRTVA